MVVVTPSTALQASSAAKPTAPASTSRMRAALSIPASTPPLSPLPSGPPVSSQLGRRGGPGWRGAPWVVSLVTVAKAAALRRCWELEVFGVGGLRGQGSVESPGGDGEADDPDFRQGEAHCPEAATRGTGPSSEGAGAAGPPRPGEGRHARRLGPGEGFTCRPEASIL